MFFGKKDKDVRLTDKQYKDITSNMSKKNAESLSDDRMNFVGNEKKIGCLDGWSLRMSWMTCNGL